jgi:hypothetical protein
MRKRGWLFEDCSDEMYIVHKPWAPRRSVFLLMGISCLLFSLCLLKICSYKLWVNPVEQLWEALFGIPAPYSVAPNAIIRSRAWHFAEHGLKCQPVRRFIRPHAHSWARNEHHQMNEVGRFSPRSEGICSTLCGGFFPCFPQRRPQCQFVTSRPC